jgi:hypothetical protein
MAMSSDVHEAPIAYCENARLISAAMFIEDA